MPIFVERFVLAILAFVVTGVCILNPWKWDWQQRISLGLAIVSFAYFLGHTYSRNNSVAPQSSVTQATSPATEPNQKTGNATANGKNSVANTGNVGDITISSDQSSHLGGPPQRNKKE